MPARDPHAFLSFGPTAGLPAGYARLAAGAPLERGHAAGRGPDFFGPAVGMPGRNRFDVTGPRTDADPGACYLAFSMVGVLLERVLRGVWLPVLSRARLSVDHDWTAAELVAPLVLLDLWAAPLVHGLEVAQISAPPQRVPRPLPGAPYAVHPDGRPVVPYPDTQRLADGWAAQNAAAAFPITTGRIDGVLYGSRFGPAAVCVALWGRAAAAVRWTATSSLGAAPRLADAANQLGIGLTA